MLAEETNVKDETGAGPQIRTPFPVNSEGILSALSLSLSTVSLRSPMKSEGVRGGSRFEGVVTARDVEGTRAVVRDVMSFEW